MRPQDIARSAAAAIRYQAFIEECRDLFVNGASVGMMQDRTKKSRRTVRAVTQRLIKHDLLFSNRRSKATLYFLNTEDLDREEKTYLAEMAARRKARKVQERARIMQKRTSYKRLTPAMPKMSSKKLASVGAAFKLATAYHPEHIKTEYCPAGIDSRYTPVEPFPKIWSALPIGSYPW